MPNKHKKIDNLIETSLVAIFLVLAAILFLYQVIPSHNPLLGYCRIDNGLFCFIVNKIRLGSSEIRMNHCQA
jgi:hypothetical protein